METKIKPLWRSKTVWFNATLLIVETAALLQGIVPQDPKTLAILAFIHGFGNLVLRIFFTGSPIGGVFKREEGSEETE